MAEMRVVTCDVSKAAIYRRVAAAFVLLSAAAVAFPEGGLAQGLDCGKLQAQIAALDQADARANPYAGAMQKQRAEIDRTRAYAQSVGCDRQQFLFFGSAPPPQCASISARIQQMRANLAQLEANSGRTATNVQRQELAQRYNAYCRSEAPPQQRGFLESLFGIPSQTPSDQLGDQPILPPEDLKPHGGSEAVCVRTCDGGFFPLSYSARHPGESLTDLCRALCPNTEVSVYTRVPGQEIQTAVGLDGAVYTDLPTALKFQKTFDATCTCRPAGQSWAEALAGAEKVLGHERKDIIVTPEKSAEMSRPKVDPPQRTKQQAGVPPKTGDAKTNPDKTQDDIESRDAASAAQVPTASKDSAGIAGGEVKNSTSYPEGQGQTVEVTGPDGVKRRVRIVGPPL
jgi:Protein of unknown function (DUF2865)